ncbi:MAG: cupin domain-containing protein [Cyanobacteria bacterium P01_G01_bin.38]
MMTIDSSNNTAFTTQLRSQIEYPATGIKRKELIKTDGCIALLMCLAAGTELSEHTAPRTVTLTVIEGRGILTLEGKPVDLEPGVFVYMPARTPHALQAVENLAFLHT